MTTEIKETKSAAPFSYDELPYPNHAMSYVSPEHMETIGTVFGINPPKASTARVLELGCGTGLGSISFGARNPNSKATAIDMSKVQIDHGSKYIKSLNIKNVELKAMSIMDIDKSFGEFDYIICHGVFSWVPKEVQNKILDIVKNHLSPNGLAHISYNALPGWNIAQTFRDMMQYHADMFKSQTDKIAQAQAFIQFIDGALAESNTPYSKFLRQEAQIVNSQGPSYLKHEYLDQGNSQFYFSDFISIATSHKLQYLGDSSLATMYLGNLPAKAAEQLKQIPNIIASEQYMDFVVNRRFRNTLLCKDNVNIVRNVSPDILNNLHITMTLTATTPLDKAKIDTDEDQSFAFAKTGVNFTVKAPILKAAFYTFIEHAGKFLSFDEIVKEISTKLPKANKEEIVNVLKGSLIQYLFQGFVEARTTAPSAICKISEKPKTSDLVRYEITTNEQKLTNELGDSLQMNLIQRLVAYYADGVNTISQIIDKVFEHVKKGELNISSGDKVVSDEKDQKKFIDIHVRDILSILKSNYYLVG